MALRTFTYLSLGLLLALTSAKIPSFLQVCGRQNPKFNECILNSVMDLLPRLKVGIPELDIPPMEPLSIDLIPVTSNIGNFKANVTNVKLQGLSTFQITKLHTDLPSLWFDFQIVFPKVILDADLDVQSKILVPIEDKGPIHVVLDHILANVTVKGERVKRKGQTMLFLSRMTAKLGMKNFEAIYQPEAEDTNNPIIKAVNTVLLNNRVEIMENVLPNIENDVCTKVLEIANRICKDFTYDELFPDRV